MYLFIYLWLGIVHPIYLSTFEIKVSDDQHWKMSIRIFYDDLEDAIQNETGIRPNLKIGDLENHYASIEELLTGHMAIFRGDNKLEYTCEQATKINDVILITVVGLSDWPDGEIQIRCDLLLNIFHSQKNIVTVQKDTDLSTYYLHRARTTMTHRQ